MFIKNRLINMFLVFLLFIGAGASVNAMKRTCQDLGPGPDEDELQSAPSLAALAARSVAQQMKETGDTTDYLQSNGDEKIIIGQELFNLEDALLLVKSIHECNLMPEEIVIDALSLSLKSHNKSLDKILDNDLDYNALHWAFFKSNYEYDIEWESVDSRLWIARIILHTALKRNVNEFVNLLEISTDTILSRAAELHSPKLCQLILGKEKLLKADQIRGLILGYEHEAPALEFAIGEPNDDVIILKLFLKYAKKHHFMTEFFTADKTYYMPLFRAVEKGNVEALKVLLNAAAEHGQNFLWDMLTVTNQNNGNSIFSYALGMYQKHEICRNPKIIELILQASGSKADQLITPLVNDNLQLIVKDPQLRDNHLLINDREILNIIMNFLF